MRVSVFVAVLAVALPLPAAQLTILHTNDVHSHVGAHGPGFRYGGFDRIATVVEQVRATTPNVLLLDGGDWIEGSMYFRFNQPRSVAPYEWAGTVELRMFEVLGYDAIVLGNHDYIDFNRTLLNGNPVPDSVIQRLDRAGNTYPILSYNFISSALPVIDPYLVDQADVQPFSVFDVGGVRVAMAGLTEELFVYQMYLEDSSLDDPTDAFAQPVIDLMNNLSPPADVVMLLNHIGHGEDRNVIQNTRGLDLIVGGHSHSRLFNVDTATDLDGRDVPIVQAGDFGKFVGRLDLDIDDVTGAVTVVSYGLIPIDQNVASEPTVKAEVDTFTASLLSKHGPVFTDTVATMQSDIKHGKRESSIGNVITDAMLAATSGRPTTPTWPSSPTAPSRIPVGPS